MSIICSSYVVSDGIIISFQKILKCTLLYYEYNEFNVMIMTFHSAF